MVEVTFSPEACTEAVIRAPGNGHLEDPLLKLDGHPLVEGPEVFSLEGRILHGNLALHQGEGGMAGATPFSRVIPLRVVVRLNWV